MTENASCLNCSIACAQIIASPASRAEADTSDVSLRGIRTHLVHDVCVLLGQHHLQGIRDTGELDGVRMLAVNFVTQDLPCSLGLLNFQGTNWDPANAPQPLKVRFVAVLLQQKKLHKLF